MTGKTDIPIALRLAEWTHGLSLSDVPDEVRHAAKRCILDTIGVAVAGSRTPVARRIADHVGEQYGTGPCTILGAERHSSATGAAFTNGVAGHALDFDDTSYAGIVHGSTVVLPAILAASEHAGCDGAGLVEAFIAGAESTYALGLTLTDRHYLSGWWATGTLGAIGAAAGAARALGLTGQETTAAISLAAIQTSGMLAMLGNDAKPILAGQAARLGVESALLAGQGNTAPPQAFEDPRGVLTLMNDGRSDPAGLAGLGSAWRLVDPGIAVKAAPVCSASQAAIELTRRMIESNALERTQISHVLCEVPNLVKISLVHDKPRTPAQGQFSMPFAVGCVLAFGTLGPEHISQDILADEALQAAMSKVEMAEADDLNGPEYQPDCPECARVRIEMKDGRKFLEFLGAATGMPQNPMSDDQLTAKFRSCAAFAGWSGGKCDAVLTGLWDLEHIANVTSLVRGEAACVTP